MSNELEIDRAIMMVTNLESFWVDGAVYDETGRDRDRAAKFDNLKPALAVKIMVQVTQIVRFRTA